MGLSHQKDPQTGRDRRDDAGGSGTAQVGAASIHAAPHPSFRTTAPIPDPELPVLVRKVRSCGPSDVLVECLRAVVSLVRPRELTLDRD